ncbi:SDR family oxidoreductase [Burkholderia plantarii]|uniref:SDR family oxidoreductase n=1 Tax=Burkholderia plantarii TaxID=41899 RepID=UPI0025B75266|nr:SDR family oxidoreductase [Burkholderia plantarii]
MKASASTRCPPGNVYFEDGAWGRSEREPPDTFQACPAANPTGRMARPDEVARATVFLPGRAASFTTGTSFLVDGGLAQGVQFRRHGGRVVPIRHLKRAGTPRAGARARRDGAAPAAARGLARASSFFLASDHKKHHFANPRL